jgi:hypothetical protein
MNISKKLILPGAVVVAAFLGVAGSSAIGALQAGAATDTSGTTATTTAATTQTDTSSGTGIPPDPTKGGHTANGITETLLTGDTAEKVKAAALAAVPGGTIERVENDAEGAAYEAHMTKTDGSQVTVKLDSSFKVTSTDAGKGH